VSILQGYLYMFATYDLLAKIKKVIKAIIVALNHIHELPDAIFTKLNLVPDNIMDWCLLEVLAFVAQEALVVSSHPGLKFPTFSRKYNF
jgi:hypothetical protein